MHTGDPQSVSSDASYHKEQEYIYTLGVRI